MNIVPFVIELTNKQNIAKLMLGLFRLIYTEADLLSLDLNVIFQVWIWPNPSTDKLA